MYLLIDLRPIKRSLYGRKGQDDRSLARSDICLFLEQLSREHLEDYL